MEQSDTVTLIPKTPRQWENHLSFEIRRKFIDHYQEGYAVYKIATTFRVTAGTVEYHLRTAGVYIPGRKPTKRNVTIPGYEKVLQPQYTLSTLVIKAYPQPKSELEKKLMREDDATERMQKSFPKCYKEYLARAKKREPGVYNGLYASTTNSFSLGNH